MTKHITYNTHCLRADAKAMTTKGNLVLYIDKDLVEKSKELGFNLSKTFENH
jgi:post-segregation antitoxin (ccd killing protein)